MAQVNEVLCKILCHNVCCLIQSMYELGVEPTLGGELTWMESKVPKTHADEESSGENQQQQPTTQWKEAFRGAWHDLSPGYMPNIVVTLIASLITPVLGVFMNSPTTIVIGVALAITFAVWGGAIAVIRRLPQPAKTEPSPLATSPTPSPTPQPALTPEAFFVAVDVVQQAPEGGMKAAYWFVATSPTGDVACPVHAAMYVRLANHQPAPTMIDSYSVESQMSDSK
jgi:hypothetical protein